MNKGRSKQDYGTPLEFIGAVEERFARLSLDLAATHENKKALYYYGPDHTYPERRDALALNWRDDNGNLWLNPPFANIEPWAAKASECWQRKGFLFLLTPASIGTDWFARHCHGRGYVLGLSPRLTFEGTADPYPKDLSLTVFGYGMRGFDTWRWK